MDLGCALYDQMNSKYYQFRLQEFVSIICGTYIGQRRCQICKGLSRNFTTNKDELIFTDRSRWYPTKDPRDTTSPKSRLHGLGLCRHLRE